MPYISYYRVSTQKQGKSGLGLEAQKTIIQTHLKGERPIAEFQDVEHGHDAVRPGLNAALALALKQGATLIVAKLDRLSREVGFIDSLMRSRVKFYLCDIPEADEFTIHIFAAMAQREYRLASSRTKAGIGSKQARIAKDGGFTDRHGEWRTKLGNDANLTGRHLGPPAVAKKAATNPNNVMSKALAEALRGKGMPMHQIAAELNAKGFKAAQGGNLNSEQVRRLLNRTAA